MAPLQELLDDQALVDILLGLVPQGEANARRFTASDQQQLEVCPPSHGRSNFPCCRACTWGLLHGRGLSMLCVVSKLDTSLALRPGCSKPDQYAVVDVR